MPRLADDELEGLVELSSDALVIQLDAELLRSRRALRLARDLLEVYDVLSVQRAFWVIVETIGGDPPSNA